MQWISDSINSLFGYEQLERSSLQKSGVLSKEQLRNFFEAGYKMFDDENVKEQLKSAARKRQNVGWLITEMQKKIFESQGVDGRFGIGFLGQVRTTYGDDAELLQELMKFVDREELALDEAELPVDQLLRKLEMKDWAMQQYEAMQHQIRTMTPDQQRAFMNEQQNMMKALASEQKDIATKAEAMSPEEKGAYINEQVKKLQSRFSMGASQVGQSHSHGNCDNCCQPTPAAPAPSMGSAMSQEEQMQFFKSLHGGRRL